MCPGIGHGTRQLNFLPTEANSQHHTSVSDDRKLKTNAIADSCWWESSRVKNASLSESQALITSAALKVLVTLKTTTRMYPKPVYALALAFRFYDANVSNDLYKRRASRSTCLQSSSMLSGAWWLNWAVATRSNANSASKKGRIKGVPARKTQKEVAQRHEIISIRGCNECSLSAERRVNAGRTGHDMNPLNKGLPLYASMWVGVCVCVCLGSTYSFGGLRSSGLVSKNTLTSSHWEM